MTDGRKSNETTRFAGDCSDGWFRVFTSLPRYRLVPGEPGPPGAPGLSCDPDAPGKNPGKKPGKNKNRLSKKKNKKGLKNGLNPPRPKPILEHSLYDVFY